MNLADIANQLATARRKSKKIDAALIGDLQSEAKAYELQSLLEEHYCSTKIGYKVGATNEATQKKLNCDAPFYGPMFEADCYESGVTFNSTDGYQGGEAEFAFVIDRDVPSDITMTAESMKDYIRSTHIAIELIGRRTSGVGLPSVYAAIADFGGNAAFISGPAIQNWQSINLATVNVVAYTDGQQTNSGSGAAVLEHPINSLVWLHKTLTACGERLLAGQWITTGTCLGVIPPKPGSTVVVDFEGCGSVTYHLR